jgi:ribosome-binding factor A
MAKSYRKERINERIKELLGELILSQIKDPRIGLVSITSVSVAPDLATAKVYFTVMGDDATKDETRKGLISAKNFLRKTIGRELKLRQAPDLRFVYDDSLDRAMRIEDAIGRIKDDGSEDGGGAPAPEDDA